MERCPQNPLHLLAPLPDSLSTACQPFLQFLAHTEGGACSLLDRHLNPTYPNQAEKGQLLKNHFLPPWAHFPNFAFFGIILIHFGVRDSVGWHHTIA